MIPAAAPMRRLWSGAARFWQRDESLSLLLALLVVLTFVLPPLVSHRRHAAGVVSVLFSLLLVSGVATVIRQGKWAVRAVGALAATAFLLRWAEGLAPGRAVVVWSRATGAVALALLAVVVITMVLRPGSVTRRRIEGAVAAYLLLGLAWAGAYECVVLLDPSAFSGASPDGGGGWVYFSLVTLTSMGYGDIAPVHPAARALATAEVFVGQMYIAILISRLVALELQARSAR